MGRFLAKILTGKDKPSTLERERERARVYGRANSSGGQVASVRPLHLTEEEVKCLWRLEIDSLVVITKPELKGVLVGDYLMMSESERIGYRNELLKPSDDGPVRMSLSGCSAHGSLQNLLSAAGQSVNQMEPSWWQEIKNKPVDKLQSLQLKEKLRLQVRKSGIKSFGVTIRYPK